MTQIPLAPTADRRASSQWAMALWAVTAAFGCYFCVYAFRKPFTAASFSGTDVWGYGFKSLLVTSQVAGYMLSKFIGVRIIAEMDAERRPRAIILLIVCAELALVLFGLVPRPWNAWCLFLNGLPLGMVFGLILGQLEGRRATEALSAGLCASFILADGITKSVGSWLLELGVSEVWMPSVAGALFLLPLGGFVAMLARVQPPTELDIAHRSERTTLDRAQRWTLLRMFAGGLIPLIILYLLISILRGIRADFGPELWKGMGVITRPEVFTQSEMVVGLTVLVINGAAVCIRPNRLAFQMSLVICGLGMLLIAATLVAWMNRWLSPFAFMVLLGQGLYLPYVAVHTTIFERLLAMTRVRGNIGFLLYVADAIGYLGYVAVIIFRNFGSTTEDNLDVLSFFVGLCWWSVILGSLCLILSWCYFLWSRRMVLPADEPAVVPS
jgi:hypothetical protein